MYIYSGGRAPPAAEAGGACYVASPSSPCNAYIPTCLALQC